MAMVEKAHGITEVRLTSEEQEAIDALKSLAPEVHLGSLADIYGDLLAERPAAPDPGCDAYIDWLDADGRREVHPEELRHLSAEEARNAMRADTCPVAPQSEQT